MCRSVAARMVQLTELSRTAAGHLVAALRSHGERVGRLRRRVLRGDDSEDVHRLRVALRRFRVAIGVAAVLIRLPPEVTPTIVATTGSALGRLRDQAMARQVWGELRLIAKGRDIARLERLAVQWERDDAPLVRRARRSLDRGRIRWVIGEIWSNSGAVWSARQRREVSSMPA